jgi:hypothetical protein
MTGQKLTRPNQHARCSSTNLKKECDRWAGNNVAPEVYFLNIETQINTNKYGSLSVFI